MASRGQLSPVVIAVLALLAEAPMHAYRMQQLIKERGVDLVVNVRNRSGIHVAVDRLLRDGLIRVHAVEREARSPERTVYEVTPQGQEALLTGLRESLAAPAGEFPLFPAVVSFVHLLTPEDAQAALSARADALKQRLTQIGAVVTASVDFGVPRVHLLEHEYRRTVIAAELDWVLTVSRDLAAGTLNWSSVRPANQSN
jgi:DNA-binding PadR family transcriptional regulator